MSQLKIKDNGSWISIPAGGIGVPSGGNQGDVLVKSSSTDYATEWVAIPNQFATVDISITTGSSAYNGWYYNDAQTDGTWNKNNIISAVILDSTDNRQGFLQMLVGNDEYIRAYTNIANTTVNIRITYRL